jgi:ribosomal protein S18 acetylase RimI-like enzyme
MNITIRKAAKKDAREVAQIVHDSWLATYPNKEHGILAVDIQPVLDRMLSADGLRKREEGIETNTIVAMVDSAVAGMAYFKNRPEAYYLSAMYVHPRFLRKGVGTALWNELLNNYFLEKKPIFVSTASYNENAINFYKKLGFLPVGRGNSAAATLPNGKVIPEVEMIFRK